MLFLADNLCTDDMKTILAVVKSVLDIIKFAIPILLIVFGIVDLSKAVISQDDKAAKEAQKRFISRLIYAVVIFLVPTIISLLFNLIKFDDGTTWKSCWDGSAATPKQDSTSDDQQNMTGQQK